MTAGDTFTVTLYGSYGAFAGLGAPAAITAALNGKDIIVNQWNDNSPSLLSELLQGDWTTQPYQITLVGSVSADDYYNGVDLGAVIAATFGSVLGTAPTSYGVTVINGVATGIAAQAPITYAATAAANAATAAGSGLLSGVTTPVLIALVVLVVGLVLVAQSGSVRVHV